MENSPITTDTPSPPSPPDSAGKPRRISGRLVALGASAVVAVYAAGYARTQEAADRIARATGERRPVVPGTAQAGVPGGPGEFDASVTPAARDQSALDLSTPDTPAPAERPASDAPAAEPIASPSAARDARAHRAAPDGDELSADTPAVTSNDRSAPAATVALSSDATPTPAARTATTALNAAGSANASLAPVAPVTVPAPAPTAPPSPAPVGYKDGTYFGWGTCRHGDIQASVVIAGGRIESTSISQCLTRYPCSWINMLPGQVVSRQSPNVDYVSGATQSTDAFYYAVIDALTKAK